ncbi:MAG: hypothetical protein GVY16_09215 [Planctomycetes bacterium]|jgi:carbamoyltransferase|nr:hypothetical protein [Planctomycetota bacterium]
MHILGISCSGHDAAAVMLRDGDLVAAAQQERFSRRKGDGGFPASAVAFCLDEAGLSRGDVDLVACHDPSQRRLLCERLNVRDEQLLVVPRHLAHAASAYLCSPFNDVAIVTVDGLDEPATTTIGHGRVDESGRAVIDVAREVRPPHSIGLFYSAFTQYCGFRAHEGEYKMMGLAALGEPRFADEVRQVIHASADGTFELDVDCFRVADPSGRLFSRRLAEVLRRPPRQADEPIDATIRDIAASVQRVTEDVLLSIVAEAKRCSGSQNLCLAGPVALNSVANGRIAREAGLDGLYVQPAAGEAGAALGAALYAHATGGGASRFVMDHAYWGQGHADEAIAAWLAGQGIAAEAASDDDDLADRVAGMLADGQVIGWLNGRFEWGPRALGARSIIADPTRPDMQDRINEKIKFREPFRPFAPAVLAERATELFDFDPPVDGLTSRFMLTVHPYRDGAAGLVSATAHGNTGRMQAVPDDHSRWRRLIEAFDARRGVPAVLNTSFNRAGEPIVNTPAEAMAVFVNSGLDALVLGRHIVTR